MVAGRETLRNHGRANNSPATRGQWRAKSRVGRRSVRNKAGCPNRDLAICRYNRGHCRGVRPHLTAGATMRLCIPLTVLVVLHPEFAAIRPSFSLDYCSWHATHIVLVEVTPRDRIFRVIESWKGELQPEELIAVPELTPASGAIPISRYLQRTDVFVPDDVASEQIAAQPAGSRMVLFLKSEEDSESSLTRTIAKSGQKWRSAAFQ